MKKLLLSIAFLLAYAMSFAQLLVPPANKTLLIIGQDLKSVYEYSNSGYFPELGGVTSYTSLYDVVNPSASFPFGGLGEKLDGTATIDIDWGAGPLNTHNAGYGYPNSTLAIGLYMTEEFFPGGLVAIANGTYDTEVTRLAKFLKDLNQPVFLRIGYEFDGNWNIGYSNTTNFINAYKHIVDIIRPQAPKCMIVWQACTSPVDDIIEGYHEDIKSWYPGDAYVDYMGYWWFLNTSLQISLTNEVIDFAREKNKPVMVSESAPQGYDLKNLTYRYINTMLGGAPGTNPVSKTPDQIWNEWYKPFFDYIHQNSDVIKVVAYINANWDSQSKWAPPYNEGYWGDSRVEVNSQIRSKWLQEINSSFWLHGSDNLFNILTGNGDNTKNNEDDNGNTNTNEPVAGFDIPQGKTLVMIGQTYTNEYQDYVSSMGKAPAGSSHYAELYSGKINQGDDANNEAFLNYIETNYPKAYAELAISIKDNPASGGYYGANGTYNACKDIVTGKWDAQIDAIAKSMKNRPSIRFFVRIGYEVSLNMFANKTTTEFIEILNKYTGMGINPLERANEIEEFDLKAYRNAFNYIAKRIREINGVENARFVFHPVRGINDAIHLYPGDEYVDYYAISLFNHDVCWPTWEGSNPPFENCPTSQAMDDNVKQSLNWAKNTIHKPIIIAESAGQSHITAQTSAEHINGYLDKIFNLIETYDVKALVYINSNWTAHHWSDQWGDSRIQKDAKILNHWKNEVLTSRYIHYPEETVTNTITSNAIQIKAFPNPFEQSINISANGEYVYSIFNSLGQKIESGKLNSQEQSVGQRLEKGMYIIQINSESGTYNQSIIKR